jgi:hypothetical protein
VSKRESALQRDIKRYLEDSGYLVEVFTCNAYQKGIPDLWVAQPDNCDKEGIPIYQWWVDVKKPKGSTLTKSQVQKWSQWEKLGVGVWILTEPTDSPLWEPPNWRDWWKPRYEKWLVRNPWEVLEEANENPDDFY